jgi:predicted kinase
MKELIICIGISGSGKSTWVRDFMKNNKYFLRINRDDIRKTMIGTLEGYYQRRTLHILEDIVSNVEESLYENYNSYSSSIILDNTNLKINIIDNWIVRGAARRYDVQFKLFDCDLDIAKKRVYDRDYWESGDLTSTNYIDKQIKQYEEVKKYILKNYPNDIIQ